MNRREAIAALMALNSVKSIAVADVKPTDVIVIESDDRLSMEQRKRIAETVNQVWPDRKVVVFDRLRMRIARESALGERTE